MIFLFISKLVLISFSVSLRPTNNKKKTEIILFRDIKWREKIY